MSWLALLALTAAASAAVSAAGLPSAPLFAALVTGLGWALVSRTPLAVPRAVSTAAQAAIGVTIGTYLDVGALAAVGGLWAAVLIVVLCTLGVSLAIGVAFAAVTGLDRPTAAIGLLAGGAAGIVGMSDDLGADGRLVAVLQYVRVLVVVMLAPLVVALFLTDAGDLQRPGAAGHADLLFTVLTGAVGLALARLTNLPAASLLVPMALSAVIVGAGAVDHPEVPSAVQACAFAGVGLQIGLRFTRATVRRVQHLLPAALVSTATLVVACAALAAVLAAASERITFLDAYLATTPGGMNAVLATAVDSGAEASFVLAVQALRLFVMLAAAPLLVRFIAPTED